MARISIHEQKFWLIVNALGKQDDFDREYRFCKGRKFRADFVHFPTSTLIEIDGGVWISGRHTRGSGAVADYEKYFIAHTLGWKVVRLEPGQITVKTVESIVNFKERAAELTTAQGRSFSAKNFE